MFKRLTRLYNVPTQTPTLGVELFFLGLLALLWGASYLFIKVAVSEIPPITLIALRVSIAGLFLLVILYWRKEHLPKDPRTWCKLFVQSFFNSMGAWTILAWGQQHIDSGLASVLNSTSPIFVFLFTFFFTRHETTNFLKLFGACLGLFGVILIVGFDAMRGLGQNTLGQHTLGQLAALIGAILYACAAIYGKKLSHLSATTAAAGTMICASFVLLPLSMITEAPWTLRPSLQAIGAIIALSVLCTGIALVIYFRLIKTLGSIGVASQAYLRAGIGVLLGVIFLGEEITLIIGAGLMAALAGVAFITLPK